MNFAELETSRLWLRRLGFEDLYDYYERITSDGDVTRYLTREPHQDIGESLAELEQTLAGYDEGGCYRWAVVLKEGEGIFGMVELRDVEEDGCGLFCMLGKPWWNQGYGTEAVEAVLRFALEELGVRKITAEHMAPNAAAGRMLEKAGMTRTGVIPGGYEKQGRVFDGVCYELSRTDSEPLTANAYQEKAMATLNPDLSRKDVLINGVMGLCGEAGECIDLVKKHLHQGHELDKAKLARELGDVAWYLAETAYALEMSLEEILRGNLDKLKKRYPQGFEKEKSINR